MAPIRCATSSPTASTSAASRKAPIKLFVTATNVRTGRGRVFRNAELTPDVLLASACLPTMFQAIEIDGEAYWDGGYSGNPTITPLIRECASSDTILVQVNPRRTAGHAAHRPRHLNRVNEVSFNATLLKELRMMAVLRQVADPGKSEGARWARMRIHRIASAIMTELGYSSKLNAEWDFCHAARRRPPRGAKLSSMLMRRISACSSTLDLDVLLDQSDAMGLLGILARLGLLIWLSYRGWSVLLLAPAAALVAAAFAGEPLLAHWTETFMGSAAQFLAQFFPLFLLGALFGKLMDDSGSVETIARFMTETLGHGARCSRWCSPAPSSPMAASACSSPSSCSAPMAQSLFRAADIPRRLMPAAVALGT